MNTSDETKPKTKYEVRGQGEPAGTLDLLAAFGVGGEMLYDGDGDGCPHCASQVLSEAA
jgi:hypothetical protein